MYTTEAQCTRRDVQGELASFVALTGAGTLGAYLFTTMNPAAGFVFGAAYYLSSMAVKAIANKIFGGLTKPAELLCDLIAVGPAIGIACGVLLAASIVITPSAMAIVAASALAAYVLVTLAVIAIRALGCAGLLGVTCCCCALFGAAAQTRAASARH